MRTFVLGAGASAHVGYPLTSDLWKSLVIWMDASGDDSFGQVIREAESVAWDSSNVEVLFTKLPRSARQPLRHAISGFFNGIRTRPAPEYRLFAEKCLRAGDTIISFNYDVSLERELKRAAKWGVGNGYGFDICPESIPDSPVKVLKLHGSTNWCGDIPDGFFGSTAFLGSRPVIKQSDLQFLGYQNLRDPECRRQRR